MVVRTAYKRARRLAKRLSERSLLMSGVASIARRRGRGDALILAYHDIVPHGEEIAGDRSLHLAQHEFAAQLDMVCRSHEVAPLDEVLRQPRDRNGQPRVAITFDDGYRGAVTVGVEELSRRGLPATIFVVPGMLDRWFWWDALHGVALDTGGRSLHEWGIREHGGRHDRILAQALAEGKEPLKLPWYMHAAAADEVRNAAARNSGVVIGSHSWSHFDLSQLPLAELSEELARPLAWLRERLPSVSSCISYPYGLAGSATYLAASDAGYAAGACITGGWLRRPVRQPFAIPRLNVPAGLSRDGFALRLSGLLCG